VRLEFQKDGHVYLLDGRRVPSVTQILQILEDLSGIPPDVLEAARLLGQNVHEAVALDVRRRLDWAVLDSHLLPYLTGWRNFLDDTKFIVIASEYRVAHSLYKYAGTLDLKGRFPATPRHTAVVDIKSGIAPRTVGAQTAAYDAADCAMHGTKPSDRYCLQLGPDFPRGYNLHPLKDPKDFSDFVSALNVMRFRRHAA
jgi:hypothetical protein